MISKIDVNRISKLILDDAIDAALQEEEELQCSVVLHCMRVLSRRSNSHLKKLLLASNLNAATPSLVQRYWDTSSSATIDMFRERLLAGDQPVFASISLRTTSTAYTVYVPVPYRCARRSIKGLQKSLWINHEFCGCMGASGAQLEQVARSVSHALANISYSVWIEDQPDIGWLALAHASSEPIYIPDVRDLHVGKEASAKTVATAEEPFLGMASVLYIPLYAKTPTQENPAPAVLMLWSPVRGRWDGCFPNAGALASNSSGPIAWTLKGAVPGKSFLKELWTEFQWTEHVAASDTKHYRRTELQVINLVLALLRWQESQNGPVKTAIGEFLHHADEPIQAVFRDATQKVSLHTWLSDLVTDKRGFVNRVLRQLSISATDLVVTRTTAEPLILALSEVRDSPYKLESAVPSEQYIELDRETARQIAASPADNIMKYAKSLDAIHIDVTEKFVTVRYVETPTVASAQAFREQRGFLRYFAIRRGLPVAPINVESQSQASSGLGLWINRVFESRTRAPARLYVSPDYAHWFTSVVVKLGPSGRSANV